MIDVINDKVVGQIRSSATIVAAWDFSTALGDTICEKFESLVIRFEDISAAIHQKTKLGGAEWLVVSPEVVKLLILVFPGMWDFTRVDETESTDEMLPKMTSELVATELMGESVAKFIGKLFKRRVYESLSIPDKVIILGRGRIPDAGSSSSSNYAVLHITNF